MVAVLTTDHKYLTVAVVNATDSEQKVDLNVSGARLSGNATVWRMTGKTLEAANKVGQPLQVEVTEAATDGAPTTFTVAPISIEIYRMPLTQ
jgi:alpha-N-arabinofuranosidase